MNFDFTADFYTLDNLQPLTLRISGQSDQAIPQAIRPAGRMERPDQAGGKVWKAISILGLADRGHAGGPGAPAGLTLGRQRRHDWTILSVTQKEARMERLGGPLPQPGDRQRSGQPGRVLRPPTRSRPAARPWRRGRRSSAASRPASSRSSKRHRSSKMPNGRRQPTTYSWARTFSPPKSPSSRPRPITAWSIPPAGITASCSTARPERIDVLPMAVCVLDHRGQRRRAIDRSK